MPALFRQLCALPGLGGRDWRNAPLAHWSLQWRRCAGEPRTLGWCDFTGRSIRASVQAEQMRADVAITLAHELVHARLGPRLPVHDRLFRRLLRRVLVDAGWLPAGRLPRLFASCALSRPGLSNEADDYHRVNVIERAAIFHMRRASPAWRAPFGHPKKSEHAQR